MNIESIPASSVNIELKSILSASSDETTRVRNKRLVEAGISASKEYVEAIKKEKRNIEEQIEDLMTFSSGTDINAGVKAINNKEMGTRIEKLHGLILELELVESRLSVAAKTHDKISGVSNENMA
jgi:predicted lipase